MVTMIVMLMVIMVTGNGVTDDNDNDVAVFKDD